MEELLDELRKVTIPAGTELHLFDIVKKDIVRPHFVTTGPVTVLIREGHGPVYALLKEYFTSPDFMSSVKGLFEDLKSLYYTEGARATSNVLLDTIKEDLGPLHDVDALLMATTSDGKAALLFIHEGYKPDLTQLR